ncbi:MAG: hypothetical protein NWF14_01285 [Candidatus Bathyarchaeota archaeon]|nr:hypothetical protein [Candidatus Bathyarchaeota archaeon]
MSEDGKTTITVDVEVNPTEDLEKVRVAVHKVLGELQLKAVEREDRARLTGKAEGLKALSRFHELLRRERILNAARRVLFNGLQGNTITFNLNKQVAYVGHISFSQSVGESPLGPIHVKIQCENPREIIEWLAPKII